MKIKSLPAALLLTCLFAVTSLAGEPIMPPAPDQPTQPVAEPAPAGTTQSGAEATLPEGAAELLLAVITSLFTSAR